MVKFNLDRLMFERGKMKVPQLQKLSGVNKNTLYAICNNTATRIDLSVIDRICAALNCQPGDIMEYAPESE